MQSDESAPIAVSAWLIKQMPEADELIVHPEGFILAAHRKWKKIGGKLAGKPRHSDPFFSMNE